MKIRGWSWLAIVLFFRQTIFWYLIDGFIQSWNNCNVQNIWTIHQQLLLAFTKAVWLCYSVLQSLIPNWPSFVFQYQFLSFWHWANQLILPVHTQNMKQGNNNLFYMYITSLFIVVFFLAVIMYCLCQRFLIGFDWGLRFLWASERRDFLVEPCILWNCFQQSSFYNECLVHSPSWFFQLSQQLNRYESFVCKQ
jgi:hypothetical protein